MKAMKFILKKDIKKTLPSFAMFVVAFVAMCLITGYGIVTGNGDFTVTALYIFYIVMLFVALYVIFQGANLLRKNMGDSEYMSKVEAEDFTSVKFIGCKVLWTIILAEILYTLYVLGFALMLLFADSKIKNVTAELGQQKFVANIETALTIVSGFFIIAGVTAFVYTGFLLCYRFFLRGKYALYGSLSTTFCCFFVVWKVFNWTVPAKGVASLVGTMIYCLIVFTICMLINLTICRKKILYKGE